MNWQDNQNQVCEGSAEGVVAEDAPGQISKKDYSKNYEYHIEKLLWFVSLCIHDQNRAISFKDWHESADSKYHLTPVNHFYLKVRREFWSHNSLSKLRVLNYPGFLVYNQTDSDRKAHDGRQGEISHVLHLFLHDAWKQNYQSDYAISHGVPTFGYFESLAGKLVAFLAEEDHVGCQVQEIDKENENVGDQFCVLAKAYLYQVAEVPDLCIFEFVPGLDHHIRPHQI